MTDMAVLVRDNDGNTRDFKMLVEAKSIRMKSAKYTNKPRRLFMFNLSRI